MVLMWGLALVASGGKALAKDYSIEEADFTVQLNVNGRAEITETRVYNFDGSFSWAEMWINLAGKCVKSTSCPDYVISGITVTGDSDNFTTEIKNRQLYIKWFYRALDETKTFVLKYTVENAVTAHPDAAEFYWKLIGDKWDKGIKKVTAKVYLPVPAPDDQIWGFGHGVLSGRVTIPNSSEVDFAADNLPPKQMFEVRVLYPKSIGPIQRQSSQTLVEILEEEKRWGEQTRNKTREASYKLIAVLMAAGIVTLLALGRAGYWIILWRKYGDDARLPEVNLAGTLHEPPSVLTPLGVEALMHWSLKPTGRSITATVIELMRKKVITFTSEKKSRFLGLGNVEDFSLKLIRKSAVGLNEPEKKLVEFFLCQISFRGSCGLLRGVFLSLLFF